MKGLSKRFVNHKGDAYAVRTGAGAGADADPDRDRDKPKEETVGFFDLWSYARPGELAVSAAGALCGAASALGLVAAILVYGELTSLFIQRHAARATTPQAPILQTFGGGRVLPDGDRPAHMDALVDDSIAFALASAAIIVAQLVTAAVGVSLSNWSAARQVTRVRYKLLCSVLRQEMAWFDTQTSMNFAGNITDETEKFRCGIGESVSMVCYLVGSVLSSVAVSFSYGWQLTLVSLCIMVPAIAQSAIASKYQTRCMNRELSAYGAASRIVEEVVCAVRTVLAFGGEEKEVQRYARALAPGAAESTTRGRWAGLATGLGWLLTYSLNAAVFGCGCVLIVRDMDLPPDQREYHLAVMISVSLLTFVATQNVAMLNPHLETFSGARGAAGRLFPLLRRATAIDARGGGRRPPRLRGDVSLRDVYFNYPARPDVKILRGLTLELKAGQTMALVGGSGSGKSTVLHLLQRLYEPEQGTITVDGHRLRDLDLHHYRTSIGVVGQEPILFSGTIRENIAIGMDHLTEEQIVEAAKKANAHDFITKLAQGYDTVVGERGASLSGGQKQRVAIARGVVRSPALLLLDEPTSALDLQAEKLVQEALDAASEGRTTIVVSHRLSTIRNADVIVVMELGAVLEQGSHAELMERRGHYWKLVQDDLSNKPAPQSAAEESPEARPIEDALQRHFQRHSSIRESLGGVRGSRRLGSVTAARLPNVALPDVPDVAEEEAAEEEAAARVSAWQLLKLNAPEWPLLVGGGVASLLVGATMPVFAMLFSLIYAMFSSTDHEEILSKSRLYSWLIFAMAAVCGVATFLQTWLFNLAGTKLTNRLRELTFSNYLRQEVAWFDRERNSVGALSARLSGECAAVQGATGSALGVLLQGVSTMLIGVLLSFAYSWKMTLVSLVSVPCVMGGIYLEGAVLRRSAVRSRRALEEAARVATEAILNVRTVHSLGIEATILERFERALRATAAGAGAGCGGPVRGLVYGVCLCAPTLGYAVSLAYGGYLVAREGLPYEHAILVSEALIYGAWMLGQALSFAPGFGAAKRAGARIVASLGRAGAVREAPDASDDPHWVAKGSISYKGLHFRYPTRPDVPVLRGLDLELEAGRTVALVGLSGCGKSTLMQLLLRFYDPDSGTVELDGRDVKSALTLRRLRAQVGLVQQEPMLFAKTIRENIAYGDNAREVPLEEVIDAATKANVHTFIASLPLGYDTVLGGGAQLSGGQKQRVAIARALVRAPRVLLLDEATAALDAGGERAVQAALDAAARGRTTLVIAHRLATVRNADLICVLDKGVVAEKGSHDELVRRRGLYYELLQQQGSHG